MQRIVTKPLKSPYRLLTKADIRKEAVTLKILAQVSKIIPPSNDDEITLTARQRAELVQKFLSADISSANYLDTLTKIYESSHAFSNMMHALLRASRNFDVVLILNELETYKLLNQYSHQAVVDILNKHSDKSAKYFDKLKDILLLVKDDEILFQWVCANAAKDEFEKDDNKLFFKNFLIQAIKNKKNNFVKLAIEKGALIDDKVINEVGFYGDNETVKLVLSVYQKELKSDNSTAFYLLACALKGRNVEVCEVSLAELGAQEITLSVLFYHKISSKEDVIKIKKIIGLILQYSPNKIDKVREELKQYLHLSFSTEDNAQILEEFISDNGKIKDLILDCIKELGREFVVNLDVKMIRRYLDFLAIVDTSGNVSQQYIKAILNSLIRLRNVSLLNELCKEINNSSYDQVILSLIRVMSDCIEDFSSQAADENINGTMRACIRTLASHGATIRPSDLKDHIALSLLLQPVIAEKTIIDQADNLAVYAAKLAKIQFPVLAAEESKSDSPLVALWKNIRVKNDALQLSYFVSLLSAISTKKLDKARAIALSAKSEWTNFNELFMLDEKLNMKEKNQALQLCCRERCAALRVEMIKFDVFLNSNQSEKNIFEKIKIIVNPAQTKFLRGKAQVKTLPKPKPRFEPFEIEEPKRTHRK